MVLDQKLANKSKNGRMWSKSSQIRGRNQSNLIKKCRIRPNLTLQGSISPTFYEQLLRQYYSFTKRIQNQTVSTKKLFKTLSYNVDVKC